MTRRALCGRRLRAPSPDGFGPRCRRKLAPAAVPTAGRADSPGHPHVPGQTAIRIPPWQMTLPRAPHWPAVIDGRHVTDITTGGLT